MEKKAISGIMLALLLMGMLAFILNIQSVKASGTIYIRADGSVEGTTDISSADNITYTFTADIYDSIVVERDNIVVDGADYTLQGIGSGTGIDLSDRSNVTIRNTNIENFSQGIYLSSSLNNTVSGNNITANNWSGIYLDDSSNNTIAKNNVTNNRIRGIELWDSSNNTIAGNNITNNESLASVLLERSSSNNISRNSIIENDYGIYLDESSNNTVSENIMNDNTFSFGVFGRGLLDNYIHSIDVSNSVNGKPVYYLINQKDLVINSSTYPQVGYLALINSTNVTVEDLTLTNNYQGLLLAYTSRSRIANCNITNNYDGVRFEHSSNNTLFENNVTYNNYGIIGQYTENIISGNNIAENSYMGIYLWWLSNNNNIHGNNIADNGWVTGMTGNWAGVVLYYSSNNRFYHNNFINNKRQIISEGSTNVWDNGYPSGGNYWSDYTGQDLDGDGIGDSPYFIGGVNQDRYPLMNPWDNTPPAANAGPDQTVYEGTLVTFDGSGSSDNVGIISYVWTFIDVTPKTLAGVSPTYTFNTPGVYTVTLKVTDASGNWATDTVTITVLSLTPEDLTQGLMGTIETWSLAKGTENSLTSKLEGAMHLLDIGNENGATHKLMDFMRQVEALRGKKLTDEQADYLVSEAQRIIDLING